MKKAVQQHYILSTTWTDCPEEVVDAVSELWQLWGHGNDYYYQPMSLKESLYADEVFCKDDAPHIKIIGEYMKTQMPKGEDDYLIHFTW